VRIVLKKAYADGTRAVDMDPLSLLCRLATSVPPPRLHTIKHAGVLAPAGAWQTPRGGGACAWGRIDANQASSREGRASQSSLGRGWQAPGMERPQEAR